MNTVTTSFRKFQRLNSLVATQHTGLLTITWFSFMLICKALYISFLQYMNNSVKKINSKTYEITYVVNGRLHKMLVTPAFGPDPILQVSNEHEHDITDSIVPYLGPCRDWHHRPFTPD